MELSVEQKAVIASATGLHARPASMLVKEAGRFASQIELVTPVKTASLKSLLGVMSLGLKQGAEVTVRATGPDEAEAAETIARMLGSELG